MTNPVDVERPEHQMPMLYLGPKARARYAELFGQDAMEKQTAEVPRVHYE